MGASSYSYFFPSGIFCPNNYGDCSYAHSVLQSLLMHPLMKIEYEYFSNLIHSCNLNNNRFRLTKELLNIYKTINKNQPANSSNIINSYSTIANENIESLGNNYKFKEKDPFHFMLYFLQFLHLELNFSRNKFNVKRLDFLSLADKRQENMMRNIFFEYLNECHNNSVVFIYFTNYEENTYKCKNCGEYYDFSLHNIYEMNLNKFYFIKNGNNNSNKFLINLDDCFNYYCNDHDDCLFCKQHVILNKTIYNGKSIIIRFKRENFTNKCDVDFPLQFDISDFSFYYKSNYEKTFYVLKACISRTKEGKYFADINIGAETNSGKWVRYLDSQAIKLDSSNDIKIFEPQILIYVLKNLERNNNNYNYNNNNPGININNNANKLINFNNKESGAYFFQNFHNNINNSNNNNSINNNNINYTQNNSSLYQNNFNNSNNLNIQNNNNIMLNSPNMNANLYNNPSQNPNQNQNNFYFNNFNNPINNNSDSQNFNCNSLLNHNKINNQFN